MKRLCFGTIFNILYYARTSKTATKVTVPSLCSALFSIYNIDEYIDNTTASHYKSGHRNVPLHIKDAASTLPFDTVNKNFIENVVPLIKDEMKEAIIRCLKDVLEEDTTIKSNEIIGYVEGFQKENIIQKSEFGFSDILVSVLYYAITKISNEDCKSNIKEIDKDFVVQRINDPRKIHFIDSTIQNSVPINRTLNDPTFDRLFEKVYSNEFTDLGNPYQISIYSADINNKKFNFRNMQEFIVDNLTTYVLSRAEMTNLSVSSHPYAAGAKSFQQFIKASRTSKETILGEILLYVFMEQVLNAPKLLTKLEIDNIAKNSKSDGVYFCNFERRGFSINQFVMGTSYIIGDLKSSIDSVFDKIVNIEKNYNEELIMIDSTITKNIFSIEMSNYLKDLLIPSKNSKNISSPDLAFGCFLGYTAKLDDKPRDNITYNYDLKMKLKEDIKLMLPYINQRIKDLNLSNYEFYFYVVPFNDATNERISIIDEMIGVS